MVFQKGNMQDLIVVTKVASVVLSIVMAAGCTTHISLDTSPAEIQKAALPTIVPTPSQSRQTVEPATYAVDLSTTEKHGDKDFPAAPIASEEDMERLRSWVANHSRLYDTASSLMIANVGICPNNVRPILGFTAKNKFSYTSRFIDAAIRALNLGDRLQVIEVLRGSGAQKAGLAKGDMLLTFNGESLPTGIDAERDASILIIQASRGQDNVQITVDREGEEMVFDVPLTQACAFGMELGDTAEISSYADGYRVMITTGMLEFVQSDMELGYVIANEFAHNLLAISRRADISAVIDQYRFLRSEPASSAITLQPYSGREDVEADRVALDMLTRSGHSLDEYAPFWNRIKNAQSDTRTNNYLALHPETDARLLAIPRHISEIERKKNRSKPLRP